MTEESYKLHTNHLFLLSEGEGMKGRAGEQASGRQAGRQEPLTSSTIYFTKEGRMKAEGRGPEYQTDIKRVRNESKKMH